MSFYARSAVALFGLVLAGGTLISCSARTQSVATQSLSAAGGTLTSPDGLLSLKVPPGALTTPAKLSIERLPSDQWPDSLKGSRLIGTVYRLGPEGLRFAQPIGVTLRTEPGSNSFVPSLFTIPTTGTGVIDSLVDQSVRIDLTTGRSSISTTMTHFSDLASGNVASYLFTPASVLGLPGTQWNGQLSFTNLLPASSGVSIRASLYAPTETGVVEPSLASLNVTCPGSDYAKPRQNATTSCGEWFCPDAGSGTYGLTLSFYGWLWTYDSKGKITAGEGRGLGQEVNIVAPATCKSPSSSTTAPPTPVSGGTGSASTSSSSTSSSTPPRFPGPIHAEFNQASYSTIYTEAVTGPSWSYRWSLNMLADPNCAAGFTGNSPAPNQATWFHADRNPGPGEPQGPCDHNAMGPSGHPGVVTLVVIGPGFRCNAQYSGTNTGDGNPPECVRT